MKNIAKDELFEHLGDFLKRKGILLEKGSYTRRIRQGCNLLSDAINATQKTMVRARAEMDKSLTKLRTSLRKQAAKKKVAKKKAASRAGAQPPVLKTRARKKTARKAARKKTAARKTVKRVARKKSSRKTARKKAA